MHENASENTVCETAAILSRGRWVNFIPHFTVYLITYPCWDILIKGAPVIALTLVGLNDDNVKS